MIDPRLDIVDGRTQAAIEARILVQAELLLLLDAHHKMRLILLERSTYGRDPTGQIGPADRNIPFVKPGDIGGNRFANLDLA